MVGRNIRILPKADEAFFRSRIEKPFWEEKLQVADQAIKKRLQWSVLDGTYFEEGCDRFECNVSPGGLFRVKNA